jgi:hypothetical protein
MSDSHVHLVDFEAYCKDLPVTGAADHEAEALLLTCMDFRFFLKIARIMDKFRLTKNYDHVILAGAALGAVVPEKPSWQETFRDHLTLAMDLHKIKRVIVMEHRECGAYGEKGFRILLPPYTPEQERAAHCKQVETLRGRIPKSLRFDAFLLNVPKGEEALTFDQLT